MKFTINGFSQSKLVEFGLDINDAIILRHFIDFKDSGKMVCEVIDDECYYWLKYEGILNQLPILKLKKDSVYRRLKKMCEVDVLRHKTVKRAGSYSFYTVGSKYVELISQENTDMLDINLKEVDKNPRASENTPNERDIHTEGIRNEIQEVSGLNPEQKINLLKYSSNNKLNNKKLYELYEKNGFGLLNKRAMELIDNDVILYGVGLVEKAINEAIKQNKLNFRYVEGILRNWKAQEQYKVGNDYGGIKKSYGVCSRTGPSRESIRLEGIAKEQGLIKEGEIQDIECEF